YNATLYAGASIHWVWAREKTKDASHSTWVNGKTYYANDGDWKYAESRNFSLRAGLLNSFAVCKNFDILLDLRFEEVQEHIDGYSKMWTEYPSVLLGFAYKFEKTGWNAPVVPVCGASSKCSDEECDALVQKLQDANAKIANLERQLRDCLNRKPEIIEAEQEDAPLATIYYPINVSKIVGVQNNVVDAVAEVMLSEDKNYVLTGWADNYTGNDDINTRLRKDRVAGVKNALIKKGVAESRLEAQINNGNLTNFGAKCASLDRAVTIKRAK
ncbi:MAG: hypothetical protein IK092_02000, partial [Muribaculaceae bacterium]|nr:hypothetical protein [Muribaculaceae bacterium]